MKHTLQIAIIGLLATFGVGCTSAPAPAPVAEVSVDALADETNMDALHVERVHTEFGDRTAREYRLCLHTQTKRCEALAARVHAPLGATR